MRLQAITLLTENSNRTMICTPAFLFLEQMVRTRSESIVVVAMRRPMRSQPCAQLGLRPRFMSDRGLHGASIRLAPLRRALSQGRARFCLRTIQNDHLGASSFKAA